MMAKQPWFRSYDDGVPHSLAPYPRRTLLDYLADNAREAPDAPAIIFKGTRIGWRDLDRLSDAFAASLVGLGVARGDRVGLLLPNCPQFVIAELGAWKAGAIVAPLNPIYTEQELVSPLNTTGAETIVTLTPFYARVKAVQGRTAVQQVIATNIKEFLPPALRVLFTVAKERREGHHIELAQGDVWFDRLLTVHARSPRPARPVGPDDPALILMSGGTTGTPKGVLGRHHALVEAGLQLRAWIRPVLDNPRDVIMHPLPLFHVFAGVGGLGLGLVGRYPSTLVPNPRDLDDLLKSIRQVRPALLIGVPTLFIGMINHPDTAAGKVDFRSIKLCVSGSAPLLAETKARFEALTGGRILEGYSTTEAMMACTVNPPRGRGKLGSVGLPLPDVAVRIVDADAGTTPMAPGEVGEIIVRAPQLMAGYWGNPGETAEALREHGQESWLHTGDLGFLDEEGYVFIVDRKKDLIKTSGYQVWPREIEEVIASHPAVAEVGVAGVPDQRKGEVAKAWVVLRAGMAAGEDEIRALCREHLAPYKVPARVEFRDGLPKTAIGKVLRRQLIAAEREVAGT